VKTFGLFRIRIRKHLAAFAAIGIIAAGCGDGEEEVSSASAPSGSNQTGGGGGVSLSLTVVPPSQIAEGTSLDFTPTVDNPDGVPLTFSATNLPSWASLDTGTGRVTGTPGASDVGTYSNIRLTVSGGGGSDTSPAFSIEVVAVASGSATLSWVPPTEKTDGSPLGDDLAGYKIYYGQSENALNQTVTLDNPGLTNVVIQDLTPTTWYFVATAYDTVGLESQFSNMVSKTIR